MWGRNTDDIHYHYFESMAEGEYACGKRQRAKNQIANGFNQPPDKACDRCIRAMNARLNPQPRVTKPISAQRTVQPKPEKIIDSVIVDGVMVEKRRAEQILEKRTIEAWKKTYQKHPQTICIANYKGGVGKTTLTYLLGSFLAEYKKKKVLLFDLDPQCSLSLVAGCSADEVRGKRNTVYSLIHPSRWNNPEMVNFSSFVSETQPTGLSIIRGSFEVDNLDTVLVDHGVRSGSEAFQLMCAYCQKMLAQFDQFDYILVDCPPNKMYLTQAMLRACAFYLPVTIPDHVSVYGMPRLIRWVSQIEEQSRPTLLGYVLNAVNRTGGGMVKSQQRATYQLNGEIVGELREHEQRVIGNHPMIGSIPRLDSIARALESGRYYSPSLYLNYSASMQLSPAYCISNIMSEILQRIGAYHAQT